MCQSPRGLRNNPDGEDHGTRLGEPPEDNLDWHSAVAGLRAEIIEYRTAFQDDINDLRRHFCWLLLAQTILIVGLVLGLEQLF